MTRISNPVEISKYCIGLSHPVRAKIMELLEIEGDIPLHKIEKELRGTEFEKSYNTIQSHVMKIESCGLVEIIKDKKDLTIVVPKKIVKIDVEDI